METERRLQAVKKIKEDYPEAPLDWCEMVYDFCTKNPERAERIVEGEEPIPPPKERFQKQFQNYIK